MKNNKLIIALLILVLIILGVLLAYKKQLVVKENDTSVSLPFPPSNVKCFSHFMDVVGSGYADGFRIPPFNFSDISYFRCASEIGFNQYEIEGLDKEGHKFYIHKDEGGMAPSGSDSVYNLCYKIDGVIIRNEKLTGREAVKEEGTCYWTENFPQNLTSTYIYGSR